MSSKNTMVNITQETEEMYNKNIIYNPLKEYPLFGNKTIELLGEKYIIKKCYVKTNKIYLLCLNKKTRKRKLFSVNKITDENSIKKESVFKRIYFSIKNLVLKYIKR